MARQTASMSARAAKSHVPPVARPHPPVLDVTVVLLDGGYASTALAPVEVFHSAGVLWHALHGTAGEARFRVQVASIDGAEVTSACAFALAPQLGIDEVRKADIIFVSSTSLDLEGRLARGAPLMPWLREWHARGAYIAGVCTGVAFVAESGLLDGRQATTHWAVADALRQRYPKVQWRPEFFVTEDRRVLCGGGVYAAIDLSLYLVEKFCGHEIALQCAKSLLISLPRTRQSGYAVLPLSRPHGEPRIRAAEEYLQQHFREEVPVKVLAELAGMGTRTFIRRFKAATGHLPGAYCRLLRISAAKELLEQGNGSVQAVAALVGYDDLAHFRNLFKRHTGMTPAEYRGRFAHLHLDRYDVAAA